MVGTRGGYDFEADDDQALEQAGRTLLAGVKGKDVALRLLKSAGESLAEAAQSSESAKRASRDLAKGLVRPDVLRHKDKEVRLYAALCLCHILRINAPDTPYTDAELESIFQLLNSVYGELEDPAAPHFQLCLSILETVAPVKCSLLILDLPHAEELTCQLFSTLLDAINEENAGLLEGTAVELLRAMVQEADDLPQSQLDILLTRLLPAHAAEAPASHAATKALLQRTETTVQPYLQRLLSGLLTGARSDSELRGDYHSVFYALHETLPQVLLPVMPLLKGELTVEDTKQRLAALDLVAKLLTGPGGGAVISEYEELLDALLKRTVDAEAEARRKVLDYAPALYEACAPAEARQAEVMKAAVGRLFDEQESVRKAAMVAVAALLQAHPELAGSKATEGRGSVLSCLVARLRDKKAGARREAASQAAAVMRAWVLASTADPSTAPRLEMILGIPLVLCNLAVRDTELGAHILDVVFKAGIFPAKLPPADVARYWALLWRQAGEEGRPVLSKILQGKAAVQGRVQELLALRVAAKEARTSSLAGAGSSMGGGAASGSLAGAASRRARGDPEKRLQEWMHELAGVLRDVAKPEEGLQKLLEQRDNYVFRGLATLAAYGCSYKDAVAAGKDVLQRVGSKGSVADLTRVLVARLTPALLPPEVLHAAMEEAEGSQEAQRLLIDVAGAAPQLLAQSMDHVAALFEADDPLLAECGAKVMARAGRLMLEACRAAKKEVPAELPERLAELCADGSPGCVKAAVKALVVVSGPEGAAKAAADLADRLLDRLKSPAARASHRALLAPLKGLSMLGRLVPAAFEACADEVVDFVLNDLMAADLSKAKPLREFDPQRTGREWRRPSPTTDIKAAALRTLCQALVPDSMRCPVSQAMAERAQLVWQALEPLMDTDVAAEQFEPFHFVFPSSSGEQQRAKRRRVEGGSSGSEDEEEHQEEECTDAAWVRYSAVCGVLRLARAYDSHMPAALYANLALTLQEPLVEPRHAMTHKLARCITLMAQRSQGQRASKYAACLAMFGIDPEERNRRYALLTLRDYVLQRRRVVQQQAASTAAAGGGGSMIQEMPEFMLPFLVFLLAHHPDYPTQEVLDDFAAASPEEREEEYEGGTPYSPFVAMLQFALEALVVPADHPTAPSEVARLLPAPIKLLRTLKFCEDATDEPRTQEAHQLCDMAMAQMRLITARLLKGKEQPPELGRFPGQVVLPRLCFRPTNLLQQAKRLDGSDLPREPFFQPGLWQNDLFLRTLMAKTLPGPEKAGGRPRSKPAGSRGSKGRKAAVADEEGDGAMADAEDDESVGGTPAPETAAARGSGEHEEGGRKRKAAGGGGGRGQRRSGRSGAAAEAEEEQEGEAQEDSQAEGSAGGATKPSKGTGKQRGGSGRSKPPAPTPTRQQPRRGAKSEAAGKLRAESSDEEEEEEAAERMEEGSNEEQQEAGARQQRGGGCAAGPAAAAQQQADEEDEEAGWSDSEDAAAGATGQGTAGKAAAAGAARLRASTEEEEEGSEAPPPQPQAQQRGRRKQQQQQQQGDEPSPGQENRAAANGAAARRSGGGKGKAAAAAAGKPAAAAKGKAAAGGGVKSLLKRGRA